MKIKSNIDEIICTGVVIGPGAQSPTSASFGYLSQGKPCGQVEITNILDENVRDRVDDLLDALEAYLASLIGESAEEVDERPKEIKGLIQPEF